MTSQSVLNIQIYSYDSQFNILVLYLQFMANIFLQLSQFRFKKESLREISGASSNKKVQSAIEKFFSKDDHQFTDYANILIDLLSLATTKEAKEKLLIALVYFIVNLDEEEALKCLQRTQSNAQAVILKVKFFSLVFKTTQSNSLKKWLIKKTVSMIEKQEKVSSYAGIIEHFDELVATLNLSQEETFEIYSSLISYLQRHPVYKKLCSVYVIRSLQNVTAKTVQSPQTNELIAKVIKSGVISDAALSLLNNEVLKKNELYPILQVLLTGDFEKLDLNSIKKLEKDGLVAEDVLRKMKIEAIPRLLSNVKIASYQQIAQRLSIKKAEVEPYIIDAIRQGLIKAKLDQFKETVIINRLNFRALRLQERAKLQKDLSTLISQLSSNIDNIKN